MLRAAHFHTTGRLDGLVEEIAERFKDRFFRDEAVSVDLDGDRYLALVKQVFRPRGAEAQAAAHVHELGTQLWRTPEEAARLDDAGEYFYSIQLVDNEGRFTGSIMEVRAKVLSRDRLTFSKSILRKFLRDGVTRDAQLGSPWVVREPLARRLGLPREMPEELAQRSEGIREGQLSKRRKLADGDASSARRRARDEKRARAGAEAALAPPEKKPLKFPAEDLLLDAISAQELAAETPGELLKRAARPAVEGAQQLGVPAHALDAFLAVYYFFLTLGRPLGISTMAWDDLESALRHPTHDPPCVLLAEVHGVLLNAIVRDGAHSRDLAPGVIAAKQRQAAAAPALAAHVQGGRSPWAVRRHQAATA